MSHFRRPKSWKKLRRALAQPSHKRAKNRRFLGESLESRELLAADVVTPFQNPNDRFDVDHDGRHGLSDALHVVSALRQSGPRVLVAPLASNGSAGVGAGEGESSGSSASMSIDVNGDNLLTLSDAFDVVSRLRSEAEQLTETTAEEVSVTINVGARDADVSAHPNATVSPLNQPRVYLGDDAFGNPILGDVKGQSVQGPSARSIVYTPPTNFSGQVYQQYSWVDFSGPTTVGGTGSIIITVTDVNDDPVAFNDSLGAVTHNVPTTINVLANDTTGPDDPALETLSVTAINGTPITAQNRTVPIIINNFNIGTVTVGTDANNTLTFLANNTLYMNPVRDVSFFYTVSDSGRPQQAARSATAEVSFRVEPTTSPARYSLEAVSATTGLPITSIEKGQEFDAKIFIADLRDPNESCTPFSPTLGLQCDSGIVAFDIDLAFDPTKFEVVTTSPGVPQVTYPAVWNGALNNPPTIDPSGRVRNIAESISFSDINSRGTPGPGNMLAATVRLRAINAVTNGDLTLALPTTLLNATQTFTPVLTLYTPGDDPLYTNGVPKVQLVSDTLTVVAPIEAVDDVATVTEDSSNTLITVINNDLVTAGGTRSLVSVGVSANGGTVTKVGNQIQYRPAANFNGVDVIDYVVTDGRTNTDTGTLRVTVTSVNDIPTYTILGNQNVQEDAGSQSINNFATSLFAGAANESTQTLTLSITNVTNQGLFSALPTISPAGQLSYTPAANAFGDSTVTIQLMDNGGTANGGVNVATKTFTISVASVNDTPSFLVGPTQTVNEDAGTQTVPNFATAISRGAANESGQTLTFSVTGFNSSLFTPTGQPTISSAGTLTYTPAANAFGTTTATVTLSDNGGGLNTSAPQTFTFNILSVNDAPSFTLAANTASSEDAGLRTVPNFASNISVGPANESSQTPEFTVNVTNTTGGLTFTSAPAISGNGTLTYQAAPDANGTATVSVILSDGIDSTAAQTFTLTVNPVDDAPVIVPDEGIMATAGVEQTIDLLGNDMDPDGDTLTIVTITGLSNGGTAEVVTPGRTAIRYTPDAAFVGTETISYTITDGNTTVEGSVQVVVEPASLPFARNDGTPVRVAIVEDSMENEIDVLDNDLVNPATTITISFPSGMSAAGGTLSLNANGDGVLYTPAADYFGADSFQYTITESVDADNDQVTSSTATVFITVTPVNDPPVATAASVTTAEDTAITVDALANVTDVDGDTLTLQNVGGAVNGSVSLVGGMAVFTPAAEFSGQGSFTYEAFDGTVAVTGTVNVTVTPVNDAPVLVLAGNQVTNEDITPAPVTGFVVSTNSGAANETQTLTVSVTEFTNPSLFSVAPSIDSNGTLTYTPAANVSGSSQVTVQLTDDDTVDGTAKSVTQTFTITVNPVNDAPTFAGVNGNTRTVAEDSGAATVSNFATSISKGAADESSQVLTFNLALSAAHQALFTPTGQPKIDPATGALTFTPAANAFGTATVTVTLNDNGGVLNGGVDTSASQTFDIVITPVNDAPSFTNVQGNNRVVSEDAPAQTVANFAQNRSAGPTNESSQTLTFMVTNSNNNLFTPGGQPAINSATGNLTYTLAPNAFGSANVTVTLKDNGGTSPGVDTSAAQTFTITVNEVNDAPVAVVDNLTATEADPLSTNLENTTVLFPLANDTDVDGDTLTITNVSGGTRNATVSIAADGKSINYRPPVGVFSVTDTLTYTISDGRTGTHTGTINVLIEPLSLPRARNDLELPAVQEDSSNNTLAVLGNDSLDTGTFTLSVNAGSFSNGGSATVNGDNTLSYTPAENFQGTETFTYTITEDVDLDGKGTTSTATVRIVVNNVNDNPTADDDFVTVLEDSVDNVIDALNGDSFAPDPAETLTIVPNSLVVTGHGTARVENNKILYTPAANSFADAQIQYTISDGNNGTATATVFVTVTNVNDPPVAGADTFNATEDTDFVDNLFNVLGNDNSGVDIDETLEIIAAGNASNRTTQGGTVTIENGTSIRYKPAANFEGTDTFSYTLSDGNGGTAMATVTVNVANVNDAPTAVDDFFAQILQTSSGNVLDVINKVNAQGQKDTIAPDRNETLTIVGVSLTEGGTPTTQPIVGEHGTIRVENGMIIYDPNGTSEGTETFYYTISDGNDGFDVAQVQVEVINFIFGSFSGYVYDDMSADGTYQAGERGYGSVEVHLVGTTFTGEAVSVTRETNASGKYEFTNIIPGNYTVRVDQPAFTLPGVYDSDVANGFVGTTTQDGGGFTLNFDILDGVMATQNNFRLSGYDPAQTSGGIWGLFASSSGSQAIGVVNTDGSGDGEYFALRSGWENMQAVSVELVNSTTVKLHVTDAGGTMHTFTVPSIKTTENGPYFRILAEDAASGMVAIRIVATPGHFGL